MAVVTDTFTRNDSNSVLGTADSGHAWTVLAGTFGIQSNKGKAFASGGGALAAIESKIRDGYVQADISLVSSSSSMELTWRIIDAPNHWACRLKKTASIDRITIEKADVGAAVVMATMDPAGLVVGNTYSVRVWFFRDQIQVWVGGVKVLAYQMSAAEYAKWRLATQHGIGCVSDNGGTWDNFTMDGFQADASLAVAVPVT